MTENRQFANSSECFLAEFRLGREALLEATPASQGQPGGRAGRSVGDDVIRSCLDRPGRARTSPNPVEPGPGRVLAGGTVGGGGSACNPARPGRETPPRGPHGERRLMHVTPTGRRAAVAPRRGPYPAGALWPACEREVKAACRIGFPANLAPVTRDEPFVLAARSGRVDECCPQIGPCTDVPRDLEREVTSCGGPSRSCFL